MMLPNPVLLNQVTRERHRELRAAAARRSLPTPGGLRRRIGRALILAGSAVSGEPLEPPTARDLSRAA